MILLAGLGYLIGTFSFARLAARIALPGEDISETEFPDRETGEVWVYRGVSATSVLDRAGWKWGVFVIVGDTLKAFVPTLLLRLDDPESFWFAVVAIAVMAGHVWPVWWRFKGGRGQACLFGATLAIEPVAVLVVALAGSVLGVLAFTSVYVARNVGPLLLAPWFAIDGWGPDVAFGLGIGLIYLLVSRGDVAEEWRIRRARGIPQLAYLERLRVAWADFFREG